MGRIKTRLPKGGTLILLWIGGIILLGAVGWGIGWTARSALAPRETPTSTPTRAVRLTATPTVAPVPTVAPTEPGSTEAPPTSTAAGPNGTVLPTSTPLSTSTPVEEEYEVVESGDGLLKVCRRHCPERWPPDDDELTRYAEEVARINDLPWPNPPLSPGQTLKMPPCPKKEQ